MSGKFTRKMYDNCSFDQNLKQSTDSLELILDVNKFVHCNNICKPVIQNSPNPALLVDVESSLWGIDKLSSDCHETKHPFCAKTGCLLTKDPRIGSHITPFACERGKAGENSVITTNMKMPTHSGLKKLNNTNPCNNQNGYYANNMLGPGATTPEYLQKGHLLGPGATTPKYLPNGCIGGKHLLGPGATTPLYLQNDGHLLGPGATTPSYLHNRHLLGPGATTPRYLNNCNSGKHLLGPGATTPSYLGN